MKARILSFIYSSQLILLIQLIRDIDIDYHFIINIPNNHFNYINCYFVDKFVIINIIIMVDIGIKYIHFLTNVHNFNHYDNYDTYFMFFKFIFNKIIINS